MKPAEMKIKIRKADPTVSEQVWARSWWEWRCPYHLMNAPNGGARSWDLAMYLVNMHLKAEHVKPGYQLVPGPIGVVALKRLGNPE